MPLTTTTDTRPPESRHTLGKFQGEPLYVEAFWNQTLDGGADYDLYDGDMLVSAFIVGEGDRADWPELGDCYALAVWERDDGFVCSLRMDHAGFEAWRRACELAPGERGDEDDEDDEDVH